MSEGRKKNRKSKLEVRQDCDYEQHTEPDLQRYLKLLKADHNYTSVDHMPEPIQLSIKVEIEEFDDNAPFEESSDTPSTSTAHFDDNSVKSVYQHVSTLKRYGNRGICKKIIFSIEKILQTAEYTVSIAPTKPNKILNIYLRNLIGSYMREDVQEDPYDKAIKNALLKWPSFCKVTTVKDPPLFYQCHICRLSWWFFNPFREHITTHPIKNLHILFEYEKTVCYLIASHSSDVKIEYFETEGDCYRCGNDFNFHLINKDNYRCPFCLKYFSNCAYYKQHEGRCQNRKMDEQKYCVICNYHISGSDVRKHFLQTHIVRSDMLVPVINRYCSLCKQVYHSFAYHVCSKSGMNSQCSSCKRKFATRKLAELHDQTSLSNIACDLCNTVLAKKCSEIEHMLRHTDLFKLVYKCVYCTEIFVDEDSIRLHRIHMHKQKSDKRRCMQLGIPVPEICTREDAIEKIDYSKPKSNSEILGMPISEKKTKNKKNTKINVQSIAQYPDDESSQDWTNDTFGGSSQDEFEQNSLVNRQNYEENIGEKSISIFEEGNTNIGNISNCNDPSNFDENLSKNEEPMSNIEVTIETEPIDYEEMSNVFKVSPEIANNSKVFQTSKNFENFESSVEVKTEPLDENEITENSNSQNDYFSIGVTVKEEVFNQFEQENLIIKTEPIDDDYHTNDEENHDFSIDVQKSPVFDEKSPVFDEKSPDFDEKSPDLDENSQDLLVEKSSVSRENIDIKEEPNFYTPEIEYGDSDDEIDEFMTFAFGENPYPCSKCKDDFKSCRDYIIHLKLTHALPDGICPCCGEKEEKLGKLVHHLEKHVRHSYVRMKCLSKNYQSYKCINSCRVCHKTVPKLDYFKHWEKHAYDNNMKVEMKTFKQEEEFTYNAVRRMEPEMLATTLKQLLSSNDCKKCCVCHRIFSRRSDAKRHLIEHLLADAHVKREVTKTLRCQHCFEDFNKPEHYKFHMRDHGGLTIYRCDICQKTFSDSSNFAKHSKVHNVRVLVCDFCKKKFNAKSSLERHILMVHQSAIKEYLCKICNATCYSTLERRRHMMKYHKDPSYKCHMCNIVFHNLKSKWDHEWSTHGLRKYEADCPICHKSFRKFSDVKRHAREEHDKLLGFRNCKESVTYSEVVLPGGKISLVRKQSLLRKGQV